MESKAGTSFEDLPDDWLCPVCGARKSEFEPYAEVLHVGETKVQP